MPRMLSAICAALLMATLGFSSTPASANIGDYSFENRSRAERPARADRPARAERRSTRSKRSARKSANRAARSSSLTGGGLQSSGIASYYWQPQRVASGGWFNPNAMTAAHRTLPFGTMVRVTNLNNGRSVTVRINDRGPFIRGRIIDLSRAAASAVGMTGAGLARVNIAVLGR